MSIKQNIRFGGNEKPPFQAMSCNLEEPKVQITVAHFLRSAPHFLGSTFIRSWQWPIQSNVCWFKRVFYESKILALLWRKVWRIARQEPPVLSGEPCSLMPASHVKKDLKQFNPWQRGSCFAVTTFYWLFDSSKMTINAFINHLWQTAGIDETFRT